MEKIIISCLESRVETNRSIYARFLLGPFKDDNAITIATALRRSLLSKVKSIAITAIHIQGVTHEFSTIVGVRESVLDLALNFQQVVLRTKKDKQFKRSPKNKTESKKPNLKSGDLCLEGKSDEFYKRKAQMAQIGYLQMRGPAVICANDLQLPVGIECVDPTQYIATLSPEGLLVVKFVIDDKKASFDNNNNVLNKKMGYVPKQTFGRGYQNEILVDLPQRSEISKNEVLAARANRLLDMKSDNQNTAPVITSSKFDSTNCLRNTIFLDPIFDSVLHVNYIIEKDDLFNQPRERIVLEFWTNGSLHPRQALHKASLSLISTFSIFRKVFHLDSL